MSELPVAVIGAGPQGLAAAAHLVERGESVVVLERGTAPAVAVSEWGHVRLFSACERRGSAGSGEVTASAEGNSALIGR